MKGLIVLVIGLLYCAFLTAAADVIYVAGDVSGTWSADTVLVAGEISVPSDSTLVIEPGVKVLFQVYCKFIVESNAALYATGTVADSILFDEYVSGTSWHGIRFLNAADASRLEYCHMTNASATGSGEDQYGGAVYCYSTNLSIQNCTIDSCHADLRGGGIYCDSSDPLISSNAILNNSVNGGAPFKGGGGVFCLNSNPTITGNEIKSNICTEVGSMGGGIFCVESSPLIDNNSISQNYATYGGGLYCLNDSYPTISNNDISYNTGGNSGGIGLSHADPLIIGNNVSNNSVNYAGGGISCNISSPTITANTICDNTTNSDGGGIHCDNFCTPTIEQNLISGNSAYHGGGISLWDDADPIIKNNIIIGNEAAFAGGAVSCRNISHPTVIENDIRGNSAANYGGGLYCEGDSYPTFSGNLIIENSAMNGGGIDCNGNSMPTITDNNIIANYAITGFGYGGGICCEGNSIPAISDNAIRGNSGISGGGLYISLTPATFDHNEISDNSASGNGAGIYLGFCDPLIDQCTIAGNTTANHGGGIYCVYSNPILVNSIIWGNTTEQIYEATGASAQVTYSDVQGGWSGMGNIDMDPTFINAVQNDYRLLWGSPCIDAGDPDPQYNDPDGTNADMGAYYYDQSTPIRIILTPYDAPVQIPIAGGSFNFDIQATNIDSIPHLAEIWCDVTLPSGSIFGPVLGPVSVNLAGGATISRLRTQNVPGGAPAGMYHYNAYAVSISDTSFDDFMFEKLAATGAEALSDWFNSGAPLAESPPATATLPRAFSLAQNYPNPFNPVTTISFELPVGCWVQLLILDVTGRTLRIQNSLSEINKWYPAGAHRITFDGSDLASGIYFYRLRAGEFSATKKMVLLK